MTAEFTANVKANIKQLAELFKAYDLAKMGDEVQEARIKECYAVALQAGEYHAAEWCGQLGGNIKPGDRITDPNFHGNRRDGETYAKRMRTHCYTTQEASGILATLWAMAAQHIQAVACTALFRRSPCSW